MFYCLLPQVTKNKGMYLEARAGLGSIVDSWIYLMKYTLPEYFHVWLFVNHAASDGKLSAGSQTSLDYLVLQISL